MPAPLFTRLLLIFVLLFTQLGSLMHGISHALAEQSQNSGQSLPHDEHCDLCAAYAQIGSALGGSAIHFAIGESIETFRPDHSVSRIAASFAAFAARAPPRSA
ncbi:MAG: DUF2946 family protein [Nitrosomonadales bacterium]|nr:DUF2946 family protein [Nitrosomonadales bacterium]